MDEFENLQNEFKKLLLGLLEKSLTPLMIIEIKNKFDQLFDQYELDIHFILKPNYNWGEILFIPLRNIDKLAIKALLKDE